MTANYPELDELDAAFRAVLAADPAPLSTMAMLWHEAIAMERDPAAPAARTRGDAFLNYWTGTQRGKEVPGQQFATDKLPHKTCAALLGRHAASWDGPRSVTFRYDLEGGAWTGGYAIETSNEYRALVRGRAELDARFAAALAAQWAPDVTALGLIFGPKVCNGEPKLKLNRGRAVEFVTPDATTLGLWRELISYLHDHGHRHLYYASFALASKTATLSEGNSIQLHYSR